MTAIVDRAEACLKDARRMNVMLTRAKCGLINPQMDQSTHTSKSLLHMPHTLQEIETSPQNKIVNRSNIALKPSATGFS